MRAGAEGLEGAIRGFGVSHVTRHQTDQVLPVACTIFEIVVGQGRVLPMLLFGTVPCLSWPENTLGTGAGATGMGRAWHATNPAQFLALHMLPYALRSNSCP